MILDAFDYVRQIPQTGDLSRDMEILMRQNGKEKTFAHMTAVAEVNRKLAERFWLDAEKCFTAGLLHDVSAVIRPADMLAYAKEQGFILCEAEMKYPFLLHQRLSAAVVKECFSITDRGVLSAIACHTTLKENADAYDMALFIADKLAWDQEGVPPFFDAVNTALEESLEKACWVYMRYMVDSGKLLCPHTDWTAALHWLENRT